MPISNERIAELASLPDQAIDTSGISEASEEFFRVATLRQWRSPKVALPGETDTSEQNAASFQLKSG